MIKELKYLFFILSIFFFLFFTIKYYFSNNNYKYSYREISIIDKKIELRKNNIIFLKNNTDNIIEFIENRNKKEIKKYSFWDLLYND
tara:strand:+ start:216 stop:476 length:261 start_codon:yes stop_codon:yes gene_type:complete